MGRQDIKKQEQKKEKIKKSHQKKAEALEEGFKKTVIKTCRQLGEDYYWENTASYLLESMARETLKQNREHSVILHLLYRLFLAVLRGTTNHYSARKLIGFLTSDPNFFKLPAEKMKVCLQDIYFFASCMVTHHMTTSAILQHSQYQLEQQLNLQRVTY